MLLLACAAPDDDVKTTPVSPDTSDPAADAAWATLSEHIQDQIDDEAIPGFQVSIVLDGALRYTGAFGVTEYGGEDPVTDDTLFRWASVTKMHTATAFLSLVEEGAIDLEAPVTDVIDVSLSRGYDPDDITAWHLLTHTSALPDALDWDCGTGDRILGEYVADTQWGLYAPPGSFYNYSNTGFVWAGAMMESVTGQTYADVMQERVLDPAGMSTATLDAGDAEAGPHATGTTWWEGEPWYYTLEAADCGWSRPAAWLHATATDLARTAEWQLAGGGGVLSAGSVAAMHAQADTHWTPDESFQVGYGQFTSDYEGARMVWHDGWVTGFVSTWAIVPDAGFGVAVVSNADWADPYAVMYEAIDLFVGPTGETPDYTTDPDTWDGYTGTYDDPYTYGSIEVTQSGNQLLVAFTDFGTTARLYQSAGDYFWIQFEDDSWDSLRFIADEDGVYRWWVLRTGVGERVAEEAVAPRPALPTRPTFHGRWRERPPEGQFRIGG
jgi:CubicO group peptidase (beta-lactamase class C family)